MSEVDQIVHAIPDWAKAARQQKQLVVETTEHGDTPPIVTVIKGGNVWATVTAPEINKHFGLHAMRVLHGTIDPDEMRITVDSHMAVRPIETNVEAARSELKEKLKGRTMQKACDDGLCETGLITDCLVCVRVTRAQGVEGMAVFPYKYHGKGGKPFEWLDDQAMVLPTEEAGGFLVESIWEIMAEPILPSLQELAKVLSVPLDKVPYHTARASFMLLRSRGFIVDDKLTAHPEWVTSKEAHQ